MDDALALKYPRMAAMLARRGTNYTLPKVVRPMREIPADWDFDANGIRKNARQESFPVTANIDLSLPF